MIFSCTCHLGQFYDQSFLLVLMLQGLIIDNNEPFSQLETRKGGAVPLLEL